MRVLLAAAVLLFASVPSARADWVSVGPEGGPIYTAAVTSDHAAIYAVTTNNSFPLLRSTDCGANWEPYGASLSNYPRAMAAHPTDPNTLYGLVSSLFYRTTNGGVNWIQTSLGSNTNGNDIAMNPKNPLVIYVPCYKYDGANWRVTSAKSTDGGATWVTTQVDTTASSTFYAAAIDPVDTTTVYMGGYVGGTTAFYKSTDCGQTWTRYAFPANYSYLYSIYVSPVDNDIVFAGTINGVCRSTDRGETWVKMSTGNYNYQIASAPDNPDYMYSACYTTLQRSTNGGINWAASASGIEGSIIRTVFTMPGEPGAVYCGSTGGMFKSTDYGATWSAINNGILVGRIPALALSSHEPSTGLIQFTDNGMFKTTNLGDAWTRLVTPLSCGNICRIAMDRLDPLRIWMFEGSG